jgi:hypothetical protein
MLLFLYCYKEPAFDIYGIFFIYIFNLLLI